MSNLLSAVCRGIASFIESYDNLETENQQLKQQLGLTTTTKRRTTKRRKTTTMTTKPKEVIYVGSSSSDNDDDNDNNDNETNYNDNNDNERFEHACYILDKYLLSIPKIHLEKAIEILQYARFDHSPYPKLNKQNKIKWYRQIRQTINKFATPYHRQKAQTAYSTICEMVGITDYETYRLSYILSADSSLADDMRALCSSRDGNRDLSNNNIRYALLVMLNMIDYSVD